MTAPLEGIADAHLQAALEVFGFQIWKPADARKNENYARFFTVIAAHARQIAANERLAAELAELRAKYEPEPVDPVEVASREVYSQWDGDCMIEFGRLAVRRGIEMQPAPFTREEAERIAEKIKASPNGMPIRMPPSGLAVGDVVSAGIATALTTPHAELLAMLGDG